MNSMSFVWRLCKRNWRAGELRILALALVVAVAAVSAVGFFTDRVQSVLARQSNLLLAADLALVSDHPLADSYRQEAKRRGLAVAQTMLFPSMATHGTESHLAEIKAVDERYPLRGHLRIAASSSAPMGETARVPAAGTVWVEPRLLGQLGIAVGDAVKLGERCFTVSAILRFEPDRGGDMFSIAPRLMMHRGDVPGTGLIQFGSRVSYRLLVAGAEKPVEDYRIWLASRLQRGERLEQVSDARPEIRNALTKARQFLGLSAMASVILAAVAMALAGMRFVTRNLDACAVMRCLGASQGFIVRVHLLQLLLVGLLGGLAGCMLGYLAQEGLSRLLGGMLLEGLPPPSPLPALQGMLTGLAVLLGVVWPLLARLRDVPALRVLRSDLPLPTVSRWLTFLPAGLMIAALVLWTAQEVKLGAIVVGGLCGFLALAALLAWGAMRLLRRLGRSQTGSWRFGAVNLARHPAASISTVAGFSLGLTALLLLTLVRGDLLRNWQSTLPPDAPNRFTINIQADQRSALQAFFQQERMPPPPLQPMIKGRLIAVNGKPLDVSGFDERARHLTEREFNLSWAAQMQTDNRIVAGRWWTAEETGQPLLSLEQGIAETLGLHLGDWLTYDIAGETIKLRIANLRKVEWDSMRANFFAVAPPGTLERFPASYITSFYLPPPREDMLNRMVKAFPNVTIIDVVAILAQVRSMMNRMAYAVQFVFGFCLAAGMLVLYAALSATQDARKLEYTLLRVLGARRCQVVAAVLTEFALVALLAGLVAAFGAGVLGWAVSRYALDIPYTFDASLLAWGTGSALAIIPFAAWLDLRGTMNLPSQRILNSV
jgi:putative ABC transport system permease protein